MSKPIEEMSKDELQAYVSDELKLDVDLNKRHSLENLIAEVKALESKGANTTTVGDVDIVVDAKYLKHPVNERVFPSTPGLLNRGDMIPCDEEGNAV